MTTTETKLREFLLRPEITVNFSKINDGVTCYIPFSSMKKFCRLFPTELVLYRLSLRMNKNCVMVDVYDVLVILDIPDTFTDTLK